MRAYKPIYTYNDRSSRLIPSENDILYSREGGILGIACRVPANVQLCLGQRMMIIRANDNMNPEFLEIVLNSPLINDIAREKTTGGAAPRVNVSTVKAYPIPVPSLDEQGIIVSKVNELMALCEGLKARLSDAQTTQLHLADAVVENALDNELVTK
jgi:type I restriction enzyme S subunit